LNEYSPIAHIRYNNSLEVL